MAKIKKTVKRKRKSSKSAQTFELFEGKAICPLCNEECINTVDYDVSDKAGYMFYFIYQCKCGSILKYYTNLKRKNGKG